MQSQTHNLDASALGYHCATIVWAMHEPIELTYRSNVAHYEQVYWLLVPHASRRTHQNLANRTSNRLICQILDYKNLCIHLRFDLVVIIAVHLTPAYPTQYVVAWHRLAFEASGVFKTDTARATYSQFIFGEFYNTFWSY
jgi:hypothetical protein